MNTKSVDRAAMAKAAKQIETKHQDIHKLQIKLQGEMQALAGSWQSQAASAFQSGFEKFDREFEKVKAGLDEIHTSLVQTQRDYTTREDENASTANRIAGLL